MTAALAHAAARAGLSTLIVEVEGRSGIGALFGRRAPLSYAEVELAGLEGSVRGRTLTPDDALLEYLEDHGLHRVSRRLASSGALDVVSTAVPGIKDILVLGKVKQLERARRRRAALNGEELPPVDLIVLDAPAAGHAVTFLTSARGLLDAVRVGPIRSQAQDVVDLLSDPARCQVVLVTLPEETPVNEAVETAYKLEDRVGVKLAPVVVNGLYPALDGLDADPAAVAREEGVELAPEQAAALAAAAAFRREREALQAEQVDRLAAALPLPQLHLPFLFTPELGPPELEVLSQALTGEVTKL